MSPKWYTTNLSPGANNCPTIVALDAFGKLPPQYKELFDKARPLAYAALIKAHSETDKKNLADWEKKGLKGIVYSPEELKLFQEVGAAPVWKAWVTENAAKGVPAQELLDLILNEAQKAKAKLKKS
jgi:TRAP-type C4-dicarboxylate transport system substrate-binding protein